MTLMDKITTDGNLRAAWRAVRANRGGPGSDAVSLDDYEQNLAENLADLQTRLREETYVPLPLRRATLSKQGGGARELAIPAVTDRVAQRAFVHVMEEIFEPLFLPCSFGYRPGRGVSDAVEAVLSHRASGQTWLLDADVQDFFPSVDHGILMERLRRHVPDRAVLRVIGLWLEAGALAGTETAEPSLVQRAAGQVRKAAEAALFGDAQDIDEIDLDRLNRFSRHSSQDVPALLRRFGTEAARLAWDHRGTLLPLLARRGMLAGGGIGVAVLGAAALGQHVLAQRAPRRAGTPQGGPISPLLSNLYLHDFDVHMSQAGLRLVRYADDFVVCCASEARARHAQDVAAAELGRLRLTLHPEKTRILSCDDPLRFLGYEFDREGAIPVPERMREEQRRAAARRSMETIQHSVSQGAAAVRSGTERARRTGAAAARSLAGRLRELQDRKE